MEERRAHGRDGARVLAKHPVVEPAIHLRNGIEEAVVEDVDDGVSFFDGRGLLSRRGTRAHKRVDLLQQMPFVFHERRAAEVRMLREQLCNTTDLALDRATARFGGVRGEHGMELELAEQLSRRPSPDLARELVVGDRELVRGVNDTVERLRRARAGVSTR